VVTREWKLDVLKTVKLAAFKVGDEAKAYPRGRLKENDQGGF